MVLEQLYSVAFLREKPWFAFFLGLGYSFFGIAIALFTFPNDPALVAVAITSILFIPSLSKISSVDERAARSTKNASLLLTSWHISKPTILIYLFAFLGMFVTFAFFSLTLPQLATNHLFKQQLEVMFGPSGHAVAFSAPLFVDLVRNNFLVLMLCFTISLVAGNGSILFIGWNASVWGTIFGVLARTTAQHIQGNPWIIFILIMVSVVPHMLLEILSYILGAISGTMLSDGLASERVLSNAFGMLMRRVLIIFFAAIVVLFVAAAVETFVLNNFTTYSMITQLSFGG